MDRGNIIILQFGDQFETWGSLTELCKNHPDIKYHHVYALKFPFTYNGYKFVKTPYRETTIDKSPAYETAASKLRNAIQPFFTLSDLLTDPDGPGDLINNCAKRCQDAKPGILEIISTIY